MRRSRGAGKQRSDGTWEVRLTLTRLDGAKTQKSFYGATLAEAQQARDAFRFSTGRVWIESALVSDLAEAFIRDSEDRGLAESTLYSYRSAAARFVSRFGQAQAHELRTPDIVRWLRTIPQNRTADMTRTVVGSLLAFGKLNGFLDSNPLEGVRLPKRADPVRKRIGRADLAPIIAHLPPEHRPFFLLLADVGIRPWREGLPLLRSNISYSLDQYVVTVGDSKTAAGEGRRIPIYDADLGAALIDREPGPLFPFSKSVYSKSWVEAREAAGVDANVYALRRYAVTAWAERGVEIDIAHHWAGHADMSMVVEVYGEVRRDRSIIGSVGVREGVKVSDLLRFEPEN